MAALVTNLNSLWLAQKIENWVTTDDWCIGLHTADATQLDSLSRVGVGGVYCYRIVNWVMTAKFSSAVVVS